jgi:sugar phosphate isomerase/epimerase
MLAAVLAGVCVGGAALAQQPAAATPAPGPAAQPAGEKSMGRDDSAAEKLGWKLATQAWTFRDRTAFEAIETAQRLGLKYIELYPGQALSKDQPKAQVGPDLSQEQRAELRRKLAASGVMVVAFGVVNPGSDEAAVRRIFDFARDMGIRTITCEPADKAAWDVVEKLANEYSIDAACHNHPKPSKYWNPDTVLEAINGRGPRVGACADVGHWPRSGLTPVDCLKKYQGQIKSLHFKDIRNNLDQPWGTGDSDARAMLKELRRQGFQGVISLEYESGSGKEVEENAALCIDFFDEVAREIVAEEAREAPKPGK